MATRNRRTVCPRLLSLEGREMLSGLIAAMAANAPRPPTAISALRNHVASLQSVGNGVVPSGNTGGAGNGSTFTDNSATPLLGNGAVTPQEARRETFKAAFNGPVYSGPGRFSDQAATTFYRGLGGSTFFLHGDFDMAIITPTDPGKPFFGEAVLNDKSTNSSGLVGLVLNGDRHAVDSQGRPTHLTFNVDPNVYSGIFFVDAGTGTVNLTYGANNVAHVSFNGRIFTNGLTSPLINADLYSRNGRPLRLRTSHAHH